MDSIKTYPNMWVVFHNEDEDRARIDNISNPAGVKKLTKKQQWQKDFKTLVSTIEVIWDNRPDDLTDEEESQLIKGLAKKYEAILKCPK